MNTTSDWFKPTEDEMKQAASGGAVTFKNNEEVTFLIQEVNESVSSDGSPLLVVSCQLVGGENDSKPFKHWIRNNATSKGIWINMLKAFFDEATITSGTLTPTSLVGKKMKSVCKVSKSTQGKEFYNFYQFEEVGGAPNLSVVSNGSTGDIPF